MRGLETSINLKTCNKISEKYQMFYKREKDNLVLFSYHYINPTVFRECKEARELRGIIFNKETGEIVSRPFPKFFNWNEELNGVDLEENVTVNTKYDGSLVVCSYYNNNIIISSKGSFESWVVERAKEIMNDNQKQLIKEMEGYTVMFELLDPKNPIIIKYDKTELVLIGIRENKSGKILSPYEIEEIGKQFNVKYTTVEFENKKLKDIIEIVRKDHEKEGVVAYGDTDICKIKTEWYITTHKIMKNVGIISEKAILNMYINNELDDIWGFLPDHIKEKVKEVVKRADEEINNMINKIENFFKENEISDAKELALLLEKLNIPKDQRGVYFSVFRGKTNIKDAVYEYFKRKWKL